MIVVFGFLLLTSSVLGQGNVSAVNNLTTTTPITIDVTNAAAATTTDGTTAVTNPPVQPPPVQPLLPVLGTCSFDRPFACPNNEGCYTVREFCDGVQECSDGSDETRYNASIHAGLQGKSCARLTKQFEQVMCYIPPKHVCDHQLDCFFGNDECDCPHAFQCTPLPGHPPTCRVRVQFCDNVRNCPSGSDELPYSRGAAGFQCPVTKTQLTKNCMLPDVHVCDGVSDCDDGTDECFCDKGRPMNVFLTQKCFRCLDESLVIPFKRLCDLTFNCPDLSDECLCTHQRPKLCEQVCTVGQDCQGCQVGQVMCTPSSGSSSAVCINRTQVCDQKFDCPNKEDEQHCALKQNFNCANGLEYIEKYKRCDNYTDCSDGSDEVNCSSFYACNAAGFSITRPGAYDFSLPGYATACDKTPECEDFDDECNSTLCNGTLPAYCQHLAGVNGFICSNTQSGLIGKEICDGFPSCNDTAPHLSDDEFNCTNRFYCADSGKSGLPIHIAESSYCDSLTDCQDGSDEVGCSNKTHFYCKSGSPAYIPTYKLCNGVLDCDGGEDECQICAVSPFSSDQYLISSYVLQAFIWIIGLIAVIGNLFVIVDNGTTMFKATNRSGIGFTNRILVLNLALADFLLGIYLIGVGSVNTMFQGIYCRKDIEWRSSASCAGLGVIAMISVETSVFILVTMTTFRLLVVIRPFKPGNMAYFAGSCVAAAWIVSLILALCPLSNQKDYFVTGVWYRNNPFLAYANQEQVKTVVQRLRTFQDPEYHNFSLPPGQSIYTWEAMTTTIAKLGPTSNYELEFGYYAAHGVCLPRLFPDPSVDRSWGYSLLIIIINFCAFIYMVLAYILIYRRTRATAQRAGRGDDSKTRTLQRKIARIMISNFLCWIPICVMAFVSVSGTKLSQEAYAAAAIVLLPINSAANPFLYSNLLDVIWNKLKPLRSSISSITKSEDDSQLRKSTVATGLKNTDTGSPSRVQEETKI